MSSFILKNGKFIAADEKLFELENLNTFLFSEKIRAIRNNFPFFQETVELLLLKFRIFKQEVPEILRLNGRELKRQMERLLVKNKFFKSAIIQISFFRNAEVIESILSAEALDETEFQLNRKGLLVDIFDKIPKAVSGLSNLSFGSEPLWKVAIAHLSGTGFDDFLIINSEEKIIEGIGKKLLLVAGNKLIGASVETGANMDVAGAVLPQLAERAGLTYSEIDGFTVEQLFEANELFLFDSVNGIQWILGFREKRYYSLKTRQINKLINEMVSRS